MGPCVSARLCRFVCPALPPTLASCAWPANLAVESALAITDLDLSNNHIGLGGLKVAPPSVAGTRLLPAWQTMGRVLFAACFPRQRCRQPHVPRPALRCCARWLTVSGIVCCVAWQTLKSMLSKFSGLQRLGLRGNGFGDESGPELYELLTEVTSLRTIE